jgi:sulfite reductase (NADPH) flavoprotein alpha-component
MTGAGTALLGLISQGSLATVCASSQSLIEMLPTLRRLATQRLSMVFHTTAVNVSSDLNISSDYSAIFNAVYSGAALLNSFNVQEAHDLALVSHLASRRVALPFVHFFDYQTAHELSKIKLLSQAKLAPLWGMDREAPRASSTLEKRLIPDAVDDIMFQLRRVLKRRYRLFEYVGATNAEFVIISFCSGAETAALETAVSQVCKQGSKVGLVKIRLLRPWSSKHFLQAFPPGMVKRCVVVACAAALKTLHSDVIACIPHLQSCVVSMTKIDQVVSVQAALSFVMQTVQGNVADVIVDLDNTTLQPSRDSSFRKLIAWNLDSDSQGMLEIAQIIGDNTSAFVHATQINNAYSLGGVVSMTHLHLGQVPFMAPADLTGAADFVTIQDVRILAQFDVLEQVSECGSVLLNVKDFSDIPVPFQDEIILRRMRLFAFDASKIQADPILVFQIAILLLTTEQTGQKDVVHFLRDSLAFPLSLSHSIDLQVVQSIISDVALQLKPLELKSPPTFNEQPCSLLGTLSRSTLYSVAPEKRDTTVILGEHAIAWRLMFPEAYEKNHSHAVSTEEKFVIKVKENRRLTPGDYDRNVFHMELDTSGTGLKYEIGDALGVYPHNQEEDVDEFMEFYGLKPTDSVTFLNDDKRTTETRTVAHILTQVLDLFGRPPRTFYASLAEFATNPDEKAALVGLGGEQKSPKWDTEYKKQSDGMTTFADILHLYTSAHPSFIDLIKIVSPTKPRHYSIASAQSFKPNSVDLLVVLVSWETAKGETRFGQATKYLVDAKVGSSITVSVKPSVMKLPEDPLAPVLMAGLGTGMAPFRAFIQERAVQHYKGMKVGPMALYFGSRSQFEEYLYGEELEAYHNAGLLTFLRCAFSRDQPKKVYIQHKIDEDGKVIHEYLAKRPGQFYLCGPTWPCGDVQDAITAAFQRYGNMPAEKAAEEIALLKEHERYILEVY